ncbi:S-adenosyl-L-methionine-dependent methyltransferase [Mycena epipterygia]|nr:S-adenosyl-L-methionine-dependent methyltransferase [Mycena epipterygia]
MESISTLRLLANLITESVDTMERAYTDAGAPLPSLNQPFQQDAPGEALRTSPDVAVAIKNIMAAASQLTASVCDPITNSFNTAVSFHLSACLRVALELNVIEILREAGPKGAHVKKIAEPSGTNPEIVGRVLRLLATHHYFREVSAGVFINNRLSSALDTGKSPAELFEKPAERLTGTSGVTALAEHGADNTFKAAAFLLESIVQKSDKLPYNLAFRTDDSFFKVMQRPDNALNLARFSVAMRGTAAADPPEMILQGFDWGSLPSGGIVVDVGGGIGHVSLAIALGHPKLHIINQDSAPTVELSKVHWKERFPAHVDRQMVDFQTHDFFTPQPVHNAAAFLIRHCIHNWQDPNAIVILKHLRDAATPTTKLVVLETVVPQASGADKHEIPGATRPIAPPPLLPNWGIATAEIYNTDMSMHNLVGGVERTVDEFALLLRNSGWKLVQVHHCPPSPLSHLVSVPL